MSPQHPPGSVGDGRDVLPYLLAEVVAAREREREQLQCRASRSLDLEAARQSTLDALVAYAGAISSRSWPVPRSIRDDISMHRSLLRR